jgi:hypothetical protein
MGRLALTLFGPALAGIRLPAALAMGAVLILTGLTARDLGGRRPAQVVAHPLGKAAQLRLTAYRRCAPLRNDLRRNGEARPVIL